MLTGVTNVLLVMLLLLPLTVVFTEALSRGLGAVGNALTEPDSLASIQLTLLVAAVSVPFNTVCGVAAAWCIGRFQFHHGRSLLLTLIELLFIGLARDFRSPSGCCCSAPMVGLAPMLDCAGVRINIFAVPGLILATFLVTFPFVARTLIPLMQQQGSAEEEAAITLGAGFWQMFWRVTLPNVRWGLLYGVLLGNARAMGEFGAVAVVSWGTCVGRP